MKKYFLSIIVPIYNVEKYLKRCIQSILNQNEDPNLFEILLIDDGSTDSSGRIADSFTFVDNVRVFHKTNSGLLSTRVFGLSNSNGEYCAFVDSDDFVSSEYIKTIHKALTDCPSDCLCFSYKIMKNSIVEESNCFDSKIVFDKLINKKEAFHIITNNRKLNPIWIKVFRTNKLSNVFSFDFDKSITMGEDVYFFQTVLNDLTSFCFCSKSLYIYCFNIDSITHNLRPKYLIDSIKVKRKLYFNLQQYEIEATIPFFDKFYLGIFWYLGHISKKDLVDYDLSLFYNLVDEITLKISKTMYKKLQLKTKFIIFFLKRKKIVFLGKVYRLLK